jgi:hypothetical protein
MVVARAAIAARKRTHVSPYTRVFSNVGSPKVIRTNERSGRGDSPLVLSPLRNEHEDQRRPPPRTYPVFADETIELFDQISVSAGVRGAQIILAPADYLRATGARVGGIGKEK